VFDPLFDEGVMQIWSVVWVSKEASGCVVPCDDPLFDAPQSFTTVLPPQASEY
jgi:hypothetical protein